MRNHHLEDAISLAVRAHAGQLDQAGEPYILHPLRVLMAVRKEGGDLEAQCAAVLHDVVEDNPQITHEQIRELFGTKVSYLVYAVTRYAGGDLYVPDDNGVRETEEEPYDTFIKRVIISGPIAVLIKKCDVEDNVGRLDPIREADPAKSIRLEKKYRAALVQLWAAESEFRHAEQA